MRLLLFALCVLAGCDRAADPPAANRAAPVATPPSPAAPAAKPFAVADHNALYEFDFAWPAEVSAIPALARRLQDEMAKTKAELVDGARQDKVWRDAEKMDFHLHSSASVYETAGQSPRLLSLRVDGEGYTGGAHGNHGTGSLLWDRSAGREIKLADLFAEPANRDRLLTQSWCDAINRARAERRGEPVAGDGPFDECPKLDELAIIPADKDRDGRFEHLLLVASPYVAGPYAEGEYEIELPVTADLVAALANAFRPSFAAQGAQ